MDLVTLALIVGIPTLLVIIAFVAIMLPRKLDPVDFEGKGKSYDY